jgi:hypothetical protein
MGVRFSQREAFISRKTWLARFETTGRPSEKCVAVSGSKRYEARVCSTRGMSSLCSQLCRSGRLRPRSEQPESVGRFSAGVARSCCRHRSSGRGPRSISTGSLKCFLRSSAIGLRLPHLPTALRRSRLYLGLKLKRLGLPAARAGSSQEGHWFKARKRSRKSSDQSTPQPPAGRSTMPWTRLLMSRLKMAIASPRAGRAPA